jgi:hypothetical protein
MSAQESAKASQKFTCPTVTLVELETTVAVSVTTLPEATDPPDATTLPPDVMVSVVVVAAGPAQAGSVPRKEKAIKPTRRNSWQENLSFMANSISLAAEGASKNNLLEQEESTPVVIQASGSS